MPGQPVTLGGMNRPFLLLVATCSVFMLAKSPGAPDFSEGVRSTEPLDAEEQLKTFQLPDGFEITRFAAEPDIAKPMNLAFDSRGRLWVTSSVEYPYAAKPDRKARDTLRVLEDTNGDGRADKITTFADGLNIPIGLYPFNGGNSALVWSIPNIWRLDDTDGDGVADKRKILFGPIGESVDTHGMQNAFTRGFDGWIYVCHGFRNTSVVRATDGSEVRLQSGNTYRFRLDGSHIEQYTWGQVNPFGMCLDPLGNFYTADCHSSPIYQLIRGGRYPSFGKPHDGLGFAPLLMQHSHGSTALCGVAYYAGDSNWPETFRDTLFVGNVMTSRVHLDKVAFHGSSPTAIEQPDFLTSSDPWFRPVDIQLGPDGALYVADFYNRIIGHYEVPLDHPGRDRYRGRIWRITYRGKNRESGDRFENLAEASLETLIDRLGSSNLTARLLAMSEITDRRGLEAARPLRTTVNRGGSAEQRVGALWCLQRTGRLNANLLRKALQPTRDRTERVHALRIAGERTTRDVELSVIESLLDRDPFVVREAAATLDRHPNPRNIPMLLDAMNTAGAEDDHLRYVLLRALRSQFSVPGAIAAYTASAANDPAHADTIALVAGSLPTQDAANFLVQYLSHNTATDPTTAANYLKHAARHGGTESVPALIQLARKRGIQEQVALYRGIEAGLNERGRGNLPELRSWAASLAGALLGGSDQSDWVVVSSGKEGPPWILQQRVDSRSGKEFTVVSSLPPGGESFTGVLRSKAFPIPAKLSILLCGHDGYPEKLAQGLNFVRLHNAATGAEIARVPAPRRDDIVQRDLDLGAYAGNDGYLELVDGDTGNAYAWLGFAGTAPPLVMPPAASPREDDALLKQAVELASRWQFPDLTPRIAALAADPKRGTQLRVAALDALPPDAAKSTSHRLLQNESTTPPQLSARAIARAPLANPEDIALVGPIAAKLPARLQREVALAKAAANPDGLLQLAEAGHLSRHLFTDAQVVRALTNAASGDPKPRLAALTKDLPADASRLQAAVQERLKSYRERGRAEGSAERGRAVFQTHCSACHQLGGQGGLVGPQLDGIGTRGAERLLEDILNPNQNVDGSFRLSFLTLTNGDSAAGLFRRTEGETHYFVDTQGKEFALQKTQIEKREDTNLSLMPPVYGSTLKKEEVNDLLVFLLAP